MANVDPHALQNCEPWGFSWLQFGQRVTGQSLARGAPGVRTDGETVRSVKGYAKANEPRSLALVIEQRFPRSAQTARTRICHRSGRMRGVSEPPTGTALARREA